MFARSEPFRFRHAKLPFEIGPLNGREARESGLWLRQSLRSQAEPPAGQMRELSKYISPETAETGAQLLKLAHKTDMRLVPKNDVAKVFPTEAAAGGIPCVSFWSSPRALRQLRRAQHSRRNRGSHPKVASCLQNRPKDRPRSAA